jgi:hypothetical protein
MDEQIHEFTSEVTDPDGHVYRARALGRQRKDGTWVGWLEFAPRGGRGLKRKTGIETTQPNRDALEYWAGGIEPVYLEGALERATLSPSVTRSSSG